MAAAPQLLVQTIRDVTIVDFRDSSILDTVQIEQIGQQLFKLVDEQARKKLVLDFETVRFLSSSALGMLITLRQKSQAIKGTMVLCNLRANLMEVFQITNLHKLFTFATDEKAALATFGVTTAG
ncbi:MAG: STAS domain-containing protein [Phycisphaerae bacterium]|nr:STAS domain-containing protein [Phycisphaerae bacterium]